jgi:hypothetical protein
LAELIVEASGFVVLHARIRDRKADFRNEKMFGKLDPAPTLRLPNTMPEPSAEDIDRFIAKWGVSGGHERGAAQHFLLDFCRLLGLDEPDPPRADNEHNAYTFERRIERKKADGSTVPNWIDLCKSRHFVMETKQGVNPARDKSDPNQPLLPDLGKTEPVSSGHGQRGTSAFDKALERAHAQGERYIHSIPAEEGRPPFLIVCDAGYCFDIYAEFSGTGGQYERFPDPRNHRILLKDLHDPLIRARFRAIWNDPHSLDPSRHAAEVTREVAKALAELAKSLEKDGHDPQVTAGFLQRCLFTMFAEDVELLPKESFLDLLKIGKESPAGFPVLLNGLWKDMATGANFSAAIRAAVPYFNGGLFNDCAALPLRPDQILYLIHAAKQDWGNVEPAIFGTLLERALDPRERHKLGAHYTPRSYVERLVRPTIIKPLREKWDAVKAAAAQLDEKGKIKDARAAVESFHKELAAIRVLDPACGSGNFLYVSLALLKTLEAEVLDLFEKLGGDRKLEMEVAVIRPKNFLGLELNTRAAGIAQIVLWIGYFQWSRKTTGKADTGLRPLLEGGNTIENRDAVLAYDAKIPRKDEDGNFVTIWDGRTTKPHPVTGKEVPDESARTNLFDYTNPKRAEWPQADFIVGNPPFIGNKRMRVALGDGYTETLRKAWKGAVPDSADFVMYWWRKAAELLAAKKAKRFGFITTNSIHQTFNRRVLEPFLANEKKPIHLAYAIPDHPWVESADGAAVRISMTVCARGNEQGLLAEVMCEEDGDDGEVSVILSEAHGTIDASLRVESKQLRPQSLAANKRLGNRGMTLVGKGFLISPHEAAKLRGLGEGELVRGFVTGRDLAQTPEQRFVVDAFGLGEADLLARFPTAYQILLTRVKPERDQNKRDEYRNRWWVFAEPRSVFRPALIGLPRYIGTPRTAKHRFFTFISANDLVESEVVPFAFSDAYFLGVLSSDIHQIWALRQGSHLEDRPRYNNVSCFETFPFPVLEEGELKERIRGLGEKLDAHRKERQALHPGLTLTGMYNVLEKLRAGEPLNDKERKIHDEGLVSILKQIHDDLDAAVFEAYGWQDLHEAFCEVGNGKFIDPKAGTVIQVDAGSNEDLARAMREHQELLEQELLTRLVALNHERAAEEKRGLIRWLRPEYQAPELSKTAKLEQDEIELGAATQLAAPAPAEKLKWPPGLAAQVAEIQKLLPATGANAAAISAFFGKKSKPREAQITEILETLRSLGKLE